MRTSLMESIRPRVDGSTSLGLDVPVMRLGRDDPLLNHALHQHREVIHHGAEVCLLRDLYRAGAQR